MLTKIMHAHVWKIFNSNYFNNQITLLFEGKYIII